MKYKITQIKYKNEVQQLACEKLNEILGPEMGHNFL